MAEKDPLAHTITLTAEETIMLLELVTRAAAPGPEAATLASLYAKVKIVRESFS